MNPNKQTALMVACAFASALASAPSYSQTPQNNPLVRPNLKAPEVATPNLPPVPAPGKGVGDGGTSGKAAQEDFALRNQQLNAERVPLPLRLLLAPVYVTAISGDTAILRQPLPMQQQVPFFNQGNLLAGSALPGAGLGINPQQFNQFQGQPGIAGNAMQGQLPGLSNPLGGNLNQMQAPNRPITIKVVNNKVVNVQGFALKARVENNSVVLTLQDNLNNPVVFQSGLESASSPQFVPLQSTLEKTDNNYFERVQARSSISGTQGFSSKGDSGAGQKP